MFPVDLNEILRRVEQIDPARYAQTRNFTNGAVTRLSPYLSRGVISTKTVLDSVRRRGFKLWQIEKLVQELAWRDYFQNVWRAKGDEIDQDLRQPQPGVQNCSMPRAVLSGETGITAIDDGIVEMHENGYIHNHLRMYIAAVTCNSAGSHWRVPARWMYFYLRDADWASNALSWQWTAGAFSNKKYYANQENINKYCGTNDRNTFLDVGYEELPDAPIPDVLRELETPELTTELPASNELRIDETRPTFVYNFYNLDPLWAQDVDANRVLLLEPSHFAKYPIHAQTLDFALRLAANINNLQIFTGEFSELKIACAASTLHYKEHPTARHYTGVETAREQMFPEIAGYFPSFFGYWKKCEKLLKTSVAKN